MKEHNCKDEGLDDKQIVKQDGELNQINTSNKEIPLEVDSQCADYKLKQKKIIRKRTHNDMLEVIVNNSDSDQSQSQSQGSKQE